MTAHTTNAAAADEKEIVYDEMTKEQQEEMAAKLFCEGKKALLSSEFADASKNLADACQLYAKIYGEFALQCADPNFHYGKALLEMARMEPGVFGNALKDLAEDEDSEVDEETAVEEHNGENGNATTNGTNGVEAPDVPAEDNAQFEDPEKMTEEERQEVHELVEDALEENAEALANGTVPPVPNGEANGDAAHDDDDDEDANGEATGDETEDKTEENGAEGETAQDEDAEDVSNLQLAWEVLDVARLIYEKQDSDECRLKTAECRKLLGEVSIEDEVYDRAVDELAACLELQRRLMDAGDRRMAETYFQLGRALNLFNKFQEAADAYTGAIGVLKIKIEAIKEKCGTETDAETKTQLEQELAELEALVPELQTRVDDCLGSAKSASEYGSAAADASGPSADADSKAKATSIDHLIRKPAKRPTEEMNPEAMKKAKQDMNGHGDAHNGADTAVNGSA